MSLITRAGRVNFSPSSKYFFALDMANFSGGIVFPTCFCLKSGTRLNKNKANTVTQVMH